MHQTIERISARERAYVQQVLDAQFRSSAGSLMRKPLADMVHELVYKCALL